MITGKKVILRMPEKEDLDFLYMLANSEANRRFLNFSRPMSREEEEEWIRGVPKKADSWTDFVFIAVDMGTNKPIGTCGIHRIDKIARHGDIGITILDDEQEKGYGPDMIETLLKYGFESLNFEMLTIGAIENNERALHVYRDKLGFTYEGLLRRRKYKDGAYFGEHILSMTKEEWLAGKGK